MIVFLFFGSQFCEPVEPSARTSTKYFLDLREKMLVEIFGEILDRLTINDELNYNISLVSI